MSKKEEKAKQFADWIHKEVEEYYGRKCDPKDMYFRNGDIILAFESGWDEALKQIIVDARKELPEYDDDVWVINDDGKKFFCHRSNNSNVVVDKYGWCNYTGSEIVAWIRNVTFEEILAMNKDVLKRLKDK